MCCFSRGGTVAFPNPPPYGTGNTRGPGRGKAKEKGIVLSMGWRQCPLIHQSSVCSGEGPCPWGRALPGAAPMGLEGSPLPPALGTGTEPWHGQCSAQVEGGTFSPCPWGCPWVPREQLQRWDCPRHGSALPAQPQALLQPSNE